METMEDVRSLSEKRIVGVLIKWKYPFFTPLPNFRRPDDAALIGIFAIQIKDKLFPGYEKHFDRIFWFEADYATFENVYIDTNSITLPEVESMVRQIVEFIPKDRIRLLETEEFLIDPVCKMREKMQIPGPRSDELVYLRDKSVLKRMMIKHDIPTMKFAIFSPCEVKNVDEEVSRILNIVGTFPMFRKPVSGCGSGGGGKLTNEHDLKQFLATEISRKEEGSAYIVEECIDSPEMAEFWCATVLLSDGTCKPYGNILCKRGMTNSMHLKTGYPMPFRGESLEECADEFPGLAEFAIDVANKLKPPAPHVFCVQGFQLSPCSDKYLCTEVGYRVNGARGTPVCYYGAGISQETALLACHLDPDYVVEPDPQAPKFHRRYLWYPYRKGTLMAHNGLPEGHSISSNVSFNWYIEPGTVMPEASSFAHFCVTVTIDHIDKTTVTADALWIEQNYRPEIL